MTDAMVTTDPYPGLMSFQDTPEDRLRFFGREEEKTRLLNLVLAENFTLVFSRSGLGKTSLINAGLMQELRQRGFFPVRIRLTHNPKTDPLRSVYECIEETARGDEINIIDGQDHSSLWDYFASASFEKDGKTLRPVLIFDQFEELFTVVRATDGENVRKEEQFVRELADLVRGRIPEANRRKYIQELEEVADSSKRERLMSLMYGKTSMETKVVIVMREDYLPELNYLQTRIPNVFRNAFRLEPLRVDQARLAIEGPSQRKELLGEDVFVFAPGVVDHMLEFLRRQKVSDKVIVGSTVEPYQLQILCQHLNRKRKLKGLKEVSEKDLGGERGMKKVIAGYYRDVMKRFPRLRFGWNARKHRPSWQNWLVLNRPRSTVRKLCEKGLLTSTGHRNTLPKENIEGQYGVIDRDLTTLVNLRMLRMEPRLGGQFYELSHDTWIEALRSSRRKRRLVRVAVVIVLLLIPYLYTFVDYGITHYETRASIESLRDTTISKEARQMAIDRISSHNRWQLSDLNLSGIDLRNDTLRFVDLTKSDLSMADLRGTDFLGSTLEETNFKRARLEGANFRATLTTNAMFRETDWWLASGWTPEQIRYLKSQCMPKDFQQLPNFQNELREHSGVVDAAHDTVGKAIALNNRAWFRAIHGVQLDSAFDDVNKSLELLPTFPEIYDTRGLIYLQQGQFSNARADFRRAVEDTSGESLGERFYHLALSLELASDTLATYYFARSENAGYQPSYELLLTPPRLFRLAEPRFLKSLRGDPRRRLAK
jgi:tetratricopeptide (TPR) repeat protein